MNTLYLEASLEPKPNFSFYMTPNYKQVKMTKFQLLNLSPELLPTNCTIFNEEDSPNFRDACSCAYYFGLESYYETFGLSAVRVVASFSLDNVLPDWKNVSLSNHLIQP